MTPDAAMSHPTAPPPLDPHVQELEDALLSLDRIRAETLVRGNCDEITPVACLERLVIPALEDLGRRWNEGEVALSQVYMGGRICEEIVDTMLPPGDPDRKDQPRLAVAVLEDHHTLGKRMLYSVLRASGYEVTDFGAGLSVDELVRRTVADRTGVLMISALMLPAALRCREAISRLRAQAPGVRVIVGGAPFRLDRQLGMDVGADAVAMTASDALDLVRGMQREGKA